jgi:hypothetical protein
MSPALNIYDLTARESAWLGLPHSELLLDAFKAIAREELVAHFNQSPSDTIMFARTWITWRHLIDQAIPALERDPHFFVGWFRSVMVDLADYHHWREVTSKKREITGTQRPPSVSRQKVQEGIERYLDGELAAGRKGSQKRAWEWAKAMMPGATHRQVIEALAAAEGGKKQRGRPRVTAPPTKVS